MKSKNQRNRKIQKSTWNTVLWRTYAVSAGMSTLPVDNKKLNIAEESIINT